MKENLLVLICTFVFVTSGFSQEKVEQSSKLTAKKEDNKVISKKTKTLKPDKKTKELRKKLAYFQEHSPFKKSLLLSKLERKENGIQFCGRCGLRGLDDFGFYLLCYFPV